MVKLDNWETKAEKAAQRRIAAKERKQQRDQNRYYKLLSQSLISFLDTIPATCDTPLEIHLWTDSRPEKPADDLQLPVPSANNGAFVAPSETFAPSSQRRRTRLRSDSDTSTGSSNRHSTNNAINQERLCSEIFFYGSCSIENSQRKSASKLKKKSNKCNGLLDTHVLDEGKKLVGEDTPLYPNLALGRSLHDVISSTREENCISIEAVEAALQTSKIAAEKAHIVSHGLPPIDEASTKPMINAVYHLRYQSKTLQKLSEGIVPFLHDHTSSIGSIVYVVFKGVLVFDRYCGGLTLSKADQERLLNGNQGSRRRSISLGQDPSLLVQSQDQVSSFASMSIPEEVRHYHQQMVTFLPAPVLEYLVMFLGDETAGKLSLVCRNWYNTIGKKSPDLWKKFCIRNKWPTSLESSLSEVTPIMARNQFLSHYSAAKMLRTLALGLRYVGGNKCVELPPDVALCEDSESEMLQVLKVWSPCRILVAQKERCLLDLFDVVDTENGSRRLRRVVRQRVPCDVQTQRTTVIDVDLDDTLVGCVLEGRNEKFFTTFPRQCLLECAGCGKTNELRSKAVTTFNLSSMIQDFCSCNLLEETKLRFDFHEIASIDLQSIDSCHACGEGSFLFQTTLLIAYYQDEAALHADPMSLHALFHLSCLSGSIKCFSFENTGLGVDDRICSDFRRGVDCGNPFEGFVEDPKRSTIATLCTMNSFIQHTHLSPDEQICIAKTDRIQLNFNTDSDYKIILGSEHTMVAERYYCRREHVENEVDPSVERPAIGTLRIFGLALCIPRCILAAMDLG